MIDGFYIKRSGFRDELPKHVPVRILAFLEAPVDPDYEARGSRRGMAAVIAFDDGRLQTVFLCDVRVKSLPNPAVERPV